MEHERLFEEYIFGRMCEGVEKQIRDAYGDGDASASLMAAVALMAYTDFMGSVLTEFREGGYEKRFDKFLRYMGKRYVDLLDTEKVKAFDVFRSGLIHFFFVKGICTIAMKNSPGPLLVIGERPGDAVIQKPVDIGIGVVPSNGGYFFVVEKYYLDFKTACLTLYAERKGKGVKYPLPQPPRKGIPTGGASPANQSRASGSPLGSSVVRPLGDSR